MEQYLINYNAKEQESTDIDDKCTNYLAFNYMVLLPVLKDVRPNLFPFIASLNLSRLRIQKVPYILKDFKSLQELNLSENEISVLPTLFICYYFPHLKILDLSGNKLSQLEQVQALGCLPELEILNL